MQSASWIDPTLLQVMKARTAVLHRVVRKLRAWPAPNDTQAKKVRFFTLQPVIALDGIRIGKQWVGERKEGCSVTTAVANTDAPTVQLRPEAPGKLSGGISGTSECLILTHALL